jgi:hypothetical protein
MAADLETLALELHPEIIIPGVEGCGFDSEIIHKPQNSLKQPFTEPANSMSE